jgi:hypothetical protein
MPFEGFYTHLLFQDLDHLVPYSLGRNEGIGARMVGPDASRATELVGEALSERGYRSLVDGARSFFGATAQYLVFAPSCVYEIDYLYSHDDSEDAPPQRFRLERIQPGTYASHRRKPIQYVLPTLSPLRLSGGLHYVELDPATLVSFSLPDDLVKPVRRVVDFLLTANAEQGKEFALAQQLMTGRSDYNFSEHKRKQRDVFAQVTEPIGWNTRELFKDDLLEPFGVWRQIRFLEFKVRVRDKILQDLNRVLGQVGQTMGFEATLEFQGLPTLETVRTLKEDFRSGRRGFGDLVMAMI